MIKSFLKFLKSKDFKEFLTIFISGLIIIALCFLVYKCPVKASSGDHTAYFPMEQNQNELITQPVIDFVENIYNPDNYYILIGGVFAKTGVGTSNEKWTYQYLAISKEYNIFAEINNNGLQFSPYKNGGTWYGGNVIIKISNQTVSGSGNNLNGATAAFNTNGYSSLYDSTKSYYSNFKLLTNNTDNASVVLKYGWELPPDFMHDTSHATPPYTFESPVYITGHTPPTNVPPTYTINNYTWTTYIPPTLDTSNAETLLESIYNAIVYNGQYLKDNIHGELTNLVDNIGGFVEYIGDTIQYYGNLIITNIQNGITTFYNNINSAIVGIGNAIGYITQPLDMDNLTNAVNSTHIWGDVDTCTTYANDAFGIYGTVAEPNTFKIPLDLRSISLLNITQVYYIDLSWLDGAKQAIRAFMWCVVTFGLLYSVIVDIPNMIRSSK